jgi:phospholipid/cholesterol/gamma-HCH transport system substrate-binding protein
VIRRSVWVKTVVFVVVALLGVGYVAVRYLGAWSALTGDRFTAYVDLPDSGGLFTTASVTYRGVEVGRVGTIALRPDGVRVALDFSGHPHIPTDLDVVVGNGSPIGEQFVDLRPRVDHGPYLRSGSVIGATHARLPVSTQELLVNLDRLARSVPTSALRTVVDELGTAFAGNGAALRRLLDSTSALLDAAQPALPATRDLLVHGGTVLDTQNALASDNTSFARNLAAFTDALRRGDSDLRAVLDNGAPAADQLVAVDRAVDATLPILLGNLTSLGQVTAVRIPALRQVLIVYPYVVATSFGLFPGDGSTRFGVPIPPEEDQQPCKQGYLDPSKRRLPDQLSYPPVRWNSFCKAATNANVDARGAREAPEPGGARLGDLASYMNNDGLPHGAASSAGDQEFVAPDRSRWLLGSTGGEQRVWGDRSWMWLVFGPLT